VNSNKVAETGSRPHRELRLLCSHGTSIHSHLFGGLGDHHCRIKREMEAAGPFGLR
jgi:hypothetical protein